MLKKLHELVAENEEDSNVIEKLKGEKDELNAMLEEVRIVVNQKSSSSIASYFSILNRTRKIDTAKVP